MVKEKAKCVIIGRKPRFGNEHKTLFVRFFDTNDAHLKGIIPKKEYTFENIEKGLIKGLDIDYFTEGNDLVINNVDYVEIERKGSIVTVKGKHKK